ncbi:MAG: phosphoglycerate kinase [Verrucomicrobia bacterium]|nr:phosphoglycerate kinase [Verrucomicrobiota bacterium]
MGKLNIQDLDLKGQKVLTRVDFNVPLSPDGAITDDTRIQESLPTIRLILEKGGKPILMSHLGRPKNGWDPELSLAPCAKALSQLLGIPVKMANDSVGNEVQAMAADLKEGEVLLLENLRFHDAEEHPDSDPNFAKQLASLGDIYVNDAFGTAHRTHSSTATIAQYFPGKSACGLLMQKELSFLGNLLASPKRPFFAIIGGSKISSKIGVLQALIDKVDGLFIGGAMAFTFLKALGVSIGNSLCEDDQVPTALQLINSCKSKKIPLWLPRDFVAADSISEKAKCQFASATQGIPSGFQGVDIGPNTILQWRAELQKAATVFWNGPLGVFEISYFATGTRKIAESLAQLKAVTIVGGGDSVAAVKQMHLDKNFTHLSTGGGASLEFLELGHLPGVDALSNS